MICTDKTGTLTLNEMTVKSIFSEGKLYVVEGAGYNPSEGTIKLQDEAIVVSDFPAFALCNNAAVMLTNEGWQIQGDPTEAALITLAMKAGLDPDKLNHEYPRIDAIPFESEYSYMATMHQDGETRVIYVKGAPEVLLDLAQCQIDHDAIKMDLVFLGIVGRADPPWDEAFAAVKTCKHVGIQVRGNGAGHFAGNRWGYLLAFLLDLPYPGFD